jgi:hypothetical protein
MSSKTSSGYLIIADISGYTSYVAKTELEHSQEVLAELLGLVVNHFRPVLTILRLEGDAVFGNAPEGQIPRGETLVEVLETTYTAFRDHVRGIIHRTTCECNACRSIPMLDLKFIVHYGDYVVQNVSGISELVGTEVNRLFRLTKNHVTETTGWNAYILYTADSLEKIGIEPEGMVEIEENYEHLGEVKTYSVDLHQRFQEIAEARHVVLEPEEAHGTFSFDFDAPPVVVWEWLNDPRRRNKVDPTVTWSAATRSSGRTSSGATNHCAHGKNGLTCETILDWRPFEYVTTLTTSNNLPHKLMDMMTTFTLESIEEKQKTRVTWCIKLERFPGFIARMMLKGMEKQYRNGQLTPLNQLIIDEHSQDETQPEAMLEALSAATTGA